ncbi:MAG: histidinol phosphatase [Cytophaga sp.]|nr:histidinol phosphatase [Cytophaga sp.]
MWTNYHCHTHYCDGKNSIREMISAAHEQSLISLGISSHAPLPFDSPWCMKGDQLDPYLSEMDFVRRDFRSVQVYKGLEIDFIPSLISPDDFKSQLDYTIGSVHFVEQFDDGRKWEIDGAHSHFLEGYERIFRKDIKAVIRRYYELTRQMVEETQPGIVGHLDKIKIQNSFTPLFDESAKWYQEEIHKTLDVIAKTESTIEVNTRGIYQKKSDTTYPSPWVLEQIHQRQIPITLSSDAHHAKDMINLFPEMAITLNQIGFKKICILLDGRWQQVAFDEHGINLKGTSHYTMA